MVIGMEQQEIDRLKSCGFDVDGAMRRFLNNEQLYKKCLKKLLDDKSFESLKQAFDEGNCEEAFKAAHTMKGIVANLGLEKLHELVSPMVEKLRAGNLDIAEDLEQVGQVYQENYDIIEKM